MSYDKYIIEDILSAQEWSDKAKKRYGSERSFCYGQKDKKLSQAIRSLKSARNSRIQYKIDHVPDQNGYNSVLIYFEFKIKGKHYQFSFHNFNFKEFSSKEGKDSIYWDRKIGGCRSSLYSIRSTKR